ERPKVAAGDGSLITDHRSLITVCAGTRITDHVFRLPSSRSSALPTSVLSYPAAGRRLAGKNGGRASVVTHMKEENNDFQMARLADLLGLLSCVACPDAGAVSEPLDTLHHPVPARRRHGRADAVHGRPARPGAGAADPRG